MSLDNYFLKMPEVRTKAKKKTATGRPTVDNAEPVTDKAANTNAEPVAEKPMSDKVVASKSNNNSAEPLEEAIALGPAEAEDGDRDNVDPSVLQVLERMSDNITQAIYAKIDTVLVAIRDQTAEMHALGTRVGQAESRISDVEDATELLQAKVIKLEKQVGEMVDHIDDLENRSRRCNLRLIGLLEGTEGRDAVDFVETWLPTFLKITTKSGKIKVDRAHRTLALKPGPNQRPRPIIIKFHNFTDKQRVMAAARRLAADPDQPTDRLNVSFFNDYSAAVVKKRKAFDGVKTRLKRMNVDYALIYSATLRVSVNGAEKRFDTPEAASAFVDSLP